MPGHSSVGSSAGAMTVRKHRTMIAMVPGGNHLGHMKNRTNPLKK